MPSIIHKTLAIDTGFEEQKKKFSIVPEQISHVQYLSLYIDLFPESSHLHIKKWFDLPGSNFIGIGLLVFFFLINYKQSSFSEMILGHLVRNEMIIRMSHNTEKWLKFGPKVAKFTGTIT